MASPIEALGLMPAWYWLVTGFALGACLASFACVLAERIPARVSIMGRSRCQCGRPLRSHENVPVLGWLAARGRARCCGSLIPSRYLWAELSSGLLVGFAAYALGPGGLAAGFLVVTVGLVAGLVGRR